jgi:flagellar biosynthesis chaperone FliJ
MKKTIDEKLNDALGLFPTIPAPTDIIDVTPKQSQEVSVQDSNVDQDYEYARQNLRSLIDNGKLAMENIVYLAKEGESPRAYEVVGQLIKTLADTNKDLIELSKKAREAKGQDKKDTQVTQNVTNALFVGSTTELQKLIKKQ